MGVYDKRDELRRTELSCGSVSSVAGRESTLLDEWLERCRDGIERKKESHKLLNLFRGLRWGQTELRLPHAVINSPSIPHSQEIGPSRAIVRTLQHVPIGWSDAVDLYYEQIRFLAENRSVDVIVCVMPNEMFRFSHHQVER